MSANQMPPARNPASPPERQVMQTRYRLGWRGRLVLQVYVSNPILWPHGFHYHGFVGWRDATVADLQRLYEMGALPRQDGTHAHRSDGARGQERRIDHGGATGLTTGARAI